MELFFRYTDKEGGGRLGPTYEERRITLFNDRITFYGNLMAWTVHVIFLIVFWRYDLQILTWSSLISVLYYTVSFYFVRNQHYRLFFGGLFLMILINVTLSTFILGWDVNTHYFIISIAYSVFFIPNLTRRHRTYTTTFAICLYVFLFLHVSSPVETLSRELEQVIGLISIVSTVASIAVLSSIFERAVVEVTDELKRSNDQLHTLATTDGLTGLLNRKAGYDFVSNKIAEASLQHDPFAVVLADIDFFKSFNESYGHDCGDLVLKQVALLLSQQEGTSVRWGGEEFLLFLSGQTKEQAQVTIDHLRERIAKHEVIYNGERLHVTMTFGIAYRNAFDSIDLIIKEADDRLRLGKRTGKNCVIIS